MRTRKCDYVPKDAAWASPFAEECGSKSLKVMFSPPIHYNQLPPPPQPHVEHHTIKMDLMQIGSSRRILHCWHLRINFLRKEPSINALTLPLCGLNNYSSSQNTSSQKLASQVLTVANVLQCFPSKLSSTSHLQTRQGASPTMSLPC
jgi:hypothetical protein